MSEPCQHRWPWRQDISPVHLMDTPCLDGAHRFPAGPFPDGLHVHGLAAPGGEDDLRVPSHDLAGFHHSLPGRGLVPQLGKDVAPAGDLDDFGYPPDTRDEGVMPLLEVDTWPVDPDGRELPHLPDLIPHVLDEVAGGLLEPEKPADHDDGREDLVHRARVGAEDGQPRAYQLRADIRLEIGEGQHQIRLELQYLVEAEAREAADLRLVAGLGRPVRRARHADHALPRPQRIADLDMLGGQAHEALRERGIPLAVHVGIYLLDDVPGAAPGTITSRRRSARSWLCRAGRIDRPPSSCAA